VIVVPLVLVVVVVPLVGVALVRRQRDAARRAVVGAGGRARHGAQQVDSVAQVSRH